MTNRLASLLRWALLLLPFLYLTLFFFYPLLSILQLSLFPAGRADASGFVALATRPYYRQLLGFTAWQAALSTALTLAAGLPAAYALARFRFRGKTVLRAILTVPFVMPTVVVATAFLALLGPRGRVNGLLMALFGLDQPPLALEGTLALILLAHVFYNLSVVIRVVGGFWAGLDPRLEEAAAMLGASPWRAFREVTLPLLLPALGAAALLIFIFTFSSFGIVLILGGPRFATLEVEIYQQAILFFNLPLAAALSLLQMAVTLLGMALYTRLQGRATVPLSQRTEASAQRALHGWAARLGVALAVGPPTLFVLAPLLALVERSVTLGGTLTLQYYLTLGEAGQRSVFAVSPLIAIRNSLAFAAMATALSLLLGLLSAYALAGGRGRARRGLLEPLVLLPLGTSAVTLGFGFLVALDEPPLNLRAAALLVPIAHSLIAFPFVARAILPTLRSLDPAAREAARVLGATPARVVAEIDLPLLHRALVGGAVFAFAISMGEFGATALIARPEWPTLPTLLFRFLGQPGLASYGRALAMSVILMSTSGLGFMLIEQLRVDAIGEL